MGKNHSAAFNRDCSNALSCASLAGSACCAS